MKLDQQVAFGDSLDIAHRGTGLLKSLQRRHARAAEVARNAANAGSHTVERWDNRRTNSMIPARNDWLVEA